jgi:hypothetical protein
MMRHTRISNYTWLSSLTLVIRSKAAVGFASCAKFYLGVE